MKILIHVDMEGSAGVWQWRQIRGHSVEAEQGREAITLETNAAVRAVAASGREAIVWDTHGPGCIRKDLLHPDAMVAIGKGGPFLGSPLLFNDDVEAMLVVGQHSMAGTKDGNLSHTSYNHDWVDRVMFNGTPAGELRFRAMLAGRFGIPTILVTGDDFTCREARELNPKILTAEVKKSTGDESALSLSARDAQALIEAKSREALARIPEIEPVWSDGPFEVRLHFTEVERARHEVARRGGRLDSDKLTVIRESSEFLDIVL